MLEGKFKTRLKKKIEGKWLGSRVLYLDPSNDQGVGDMLVLYGPAWAILEGKKSANASTQPNQPYYVNLFDNMSFSRFVYPENVEEVLSALGEWFSFVQNRIPEKFMKRQVF
jgi:hypothetical protein